RICCGYCWLAGNCVQQIAGRGRGQRALVHCVVVLSRPQFLLVNSTSAPAAIGTKHNGLTCFHVGPPVTNVRSLYQLVKSTFLMRIIGKSYHRNIRENELEEGTYGRFSRREPNP